MTDFIKACAYIEKGIQKGLAEIAARQAAEARAEQAEAQVAMLREALSSAMPGLWESAEIENGKIILWHKSGPMVVVLQPVMWAPNLETAHREAILSDLIDLLNARLALIDTADAAAAYTARIRAEAMEEAARIAENATDYAARHICDDIAAAIRAAATEPKG